MTSGISGREFLGRGGHGFDRSDHFRGAVIVGRDLREELIVVSSYYVLFATMSGSIRTVVIESVVMMLFTAAAVAGFKSSAWIVVVALIGHGVFDAVHGRVIENADSSFDAVVMHLVTLVKPGE